MADPNIRRIGVVTTSRADYGILRPVIRALDQHPELQPSIFAAGSHFLESHGSTIRQIEADGWPIDARVDVLGDDRSAAAVTRYSAETMRAFADVYDAGLVDMIVVLGDRFELFAAAAAAVPFNLPIAHIHGGELSYGAIDDSYRHALTKIAHLHFPATEIYARRVAQMGEENWRIVVSGAPALDSVRNADFMSRDEIESRFGISLEGRPSVVTYHPVTRETAMLNQHLGELRDALQAMEHPLIVTGSNVDTGGDACSAMLRELAQEKPDVHYVENFGSSGYFGVLRHAGAMIGNSSSGIIEAASFELPVVNIGNRQNGRDTGRNVLHCDMDRDAILSTVARARSDDFAQSLKGMDNIYGDGNAAGKIADTLARTEINGTLLQKQWNSDGRG